MDRFKQTYFEECEDRIVASEEALSDMLDGDHSEETVNRVFRAIHSIKGGGGAFGFERLVEFTHDFETALDMVREGSITPDRNMCDLFLRANDIVADMIDMEKAEQSISEDFGDSIRSELQSITGVDAETKSNQQISNSESVGDGETATWAITFRPEKDILITGNEPIFILRALRELGDIETTVEMEDLPSLDMINPKHSYLGWRIVLKTDASEDEIREVFDFVEDLCELQIEQQNVPLGDKPERRAPQSPEDVLKNIKRKEDRDAVETAVTGSTSIRVDLGRIDHLVNLVGEMVIAQSMMQERIKWLPQDMGAGLVNDVENLSRHMRDLQESVMSVRAQPIKSVFTRMPRVIREASAACGKDVRLTTFGEETEVDKTVLENLIDPLTHMIRNSVDHGIESPEKREKNGKSLYGTIQLSARHKSGRILIEIKDDGAGINREVVLAKAIKQGLVEKDAQLSDQEIDNLVFKPGFSTAQTVSEVSGRGVGMDVVKRNVADLGGRISITSVPGKGCTMTLSLPLTLAVMDGMIVSVGSQRFVLPTVNIIESFQPEKGAIDKMADGVHVIRARGEFVRLMPLFSLFRINDAIFEPDESLLILLESDEGDRIAVMVDDVLGQQQVVIKSLETNYQHVPGISAATILGNGDVALILDVPGLTNMQASLCTDKKEVKSFEFNPAIQSQDSNQDSIKKEGNLIHE